MNINNFVFGREKATAQTIVGDIDFSGNINVLDFVFLKRQLLSENTSDARVFAASDINGDGNVNILDAVLLKQYLLAAVDELPAGGYVDYEV